MVPISEIMKFKKMIMVKIVTITQQRKNSQFSDEVKYVEASKSKSPTEVLKTYIKFPQNIPIFLYSGPGSSKSSSFYTACRYQSLSFPGTFLLPAPITIKMSPNKYTINMQKNRKILNSIMTLMTIITIPEKFLKILTKQNVLKIASKMTTVWNTLLTI